MYERRTTDCIKVSPAAVSPAAGKCILFEGRSEHKGAAGRKLVLVLYLKPAGKQGVSRPLALDAHSPAWREFAEARGLNENATAAMDVAAAVYRHRQPTGGSFTVAEAASWSQQLWDEVAAAEKRGRVYPLYDFGGRVCSTSRSLSAVSQRTRLRLEAGCLRRESSRQARLSRCL